MEANQCDGCKRGLAVKDKIHFEKDGKPYIGCSSSLYEKSHRPSELEIVQKALEKFKSSPAGQMARNLCIYGDGSWDIEAFDLSTMPSGNDSQSLLTWAKQQIGVE